MLTYQTVKIKKKLAYKLIQLFTFKIVRYLLNLINDSGYENQILAKNVLNYNI